MFNNMPDIGGCIMAAVVLIATLAVGLVAVLVLWLSGVRPDWWMLWVLIGAVGAMVVGGVFRRLFR